MKSVLFVCTGNLYRSPLAAAFFLDEVLKKGLGDEVKVESAGTWTKDGRIIHSQTVEDARHFGIDIHDHRSKQVTRDVLSRNDLILVMEGGQKEALQIEFPEMTSKMHLLSEVVDQKQYDIPDPFSLEGIHDREIARELHRIIQTGSERIMQLLGL